MRVTSSPYESLIQQIIEVERQPQYQLKEDRSEIKRFKGVLSDFDSKLSKLHTTLKSFTSAFDNPFDALGVQQDEDAAFSARANEFADVGNHSLRVDRLASNDTRLSQQYTKAGTTLRGFFDANGSQTFSVSVASPTDTDADNRVSIDVTVNPTGTTDAEIMAEVRDAVNAAMSDAAEAGTIKNAEQASMSVINETSDTARLSLRSAQTGYTNRLEFTDSANGFLAELGISNNTVVAEGGTGGGMVTDVGTTATDSALNSKFYLDGLTLYRDTNTVDDALKGLTLDLKRADGVASTFTVDADAESITGKVNEFIEQYNDILSYIEKKSKVDGESGSRGDFAGEYSFKNLRFSMRNDLVQAVGSQPDGAPSYLTDLGIEIEKDGKLKLADEDKLLAAVERDPSTVRSLFANETDGYATKLKAHLDRFVGTDGILEYRKESIDTRTRRLDDKINDWDTRMERRTEQLRMQYAKLQQALSAMQSQQQTMMGFMTGGYF